MMVDIAALAADLGIDPEALRARYRRERDRRLRPEGLGQFVRIDRGHHQEYQEDPRETSRVGREPLTDQVEIAVIGAGFGGLLLGAQLRKAGFADIRFIDRAGDFGGVWYWNRYPGAACDTEAPIYLPMLEELGVLPKRKYAKAPEILAHCQRIAEKFGLCRDTCFHTDVTAIRWDEASGTWTIATDRGDAMRARFVIVSAGVMDRPKLADLPGLDSFQGHSFHTSRWDYSYTGGGPDGALSGLADKRDGPIMSALMALGTINHLLFTPNPNYTIASFPFTEAMYAHEETARALYSADDPNLARFAGHGGKLILYHGWADPHISPSTPSTITSASGAGWEQPRAQVLCACSCSPAWGIAGAVTGRTSSRCSQA